MGRVGWGRGEGEDGTSIMEPLADTYLAGPVGFQSLGLEPVRGDLQPSKSRMEAWNPGTLTLEPWNFGALEPWNPGTDLGTLEPWNPTRASFSWNSAWILNIARGALRNWALGKHTSIHELLLHLAPTSGSPKPKNITPIYYIGFELRASATKSETWPPQKESNPCRERSNFLDHLLHLFHLIAHHLHDRLRIDEGQGEMVCLKVRPGFISMHGVPRYGRCVVRCILKNTKTCI